MALMSPELSKEPLAQDAPDDSRENPTLAAEAFAEDGEIITLDPTGSTTRYELVETLGQGGMGEVRLCKDQRIRRDVAMKVIRKERAATPELRARFFREVLAQGQLEHPAVVPVYDVATDEAGSLYFTMRRVRGATLEEVLKGLVAKDAGVERQYSRHKLLTAFGNVCLAVHFAHTRSVFHCNLKPANVMFGDFGEVYVLDWGLAMRGGFTAPAARKPSSRPSGEGGDGSDTSTVSGTPGYMAPEQIRGEELDGRADVYALGSILYEMLALKRMHVARTARQLSIATLAGMVERPSLRAPDRDVPPELEAICLKATTLDPRQRYASARAVYEDLERYLEGDRDLAMRRAMSREHAQRASEEAAAAHAGGPGASDARSQAMQAVSRALALDPDNAGALRTLLGLLTQPPREIPHEVVADMQATERRLEGVRARSGAMACLAWFAFIPVSLVLGIRSVPALAVSSAAWLAAAVILLLRARRPRPDGHAPTTVPIIVALAIATSSVLLGPLVLTPTIAALFALGLTMAVRHDRRHVPMIAGCLAVTLPLALEWVHVLPPSMVLQGEQLCIVPQMFHFTEHYSLLLGPNLACIVMGSLFALRFRRTLASAQQRVYVSAWQLGQLLPRAAGPASMRPPARA
jgi:serine/threonine-protein kinase